MRNHPEIDEITHTLIAMTALILSVKMNEDKVLSFDQARADLRNHFTTEMMKKLEKSMLLEMEFDLNFPTSIEFIYYFLYLGNESYNFADIIGEAKFYAYLLIFF